MTSSANYNKALFQRPQTLTIRHPHEDILQYLVSNNFCHKQYSLFSMKIFTVFSIK